MRRPRRWRSGGYGSFCQIPRVRAIWGIDVQRARVYDALVSPNACEELVNALVELIRKEVPRVAQSGRNWKVVINGSRGGDVRAVIEEHADVVQRWQPVSTSAK